MFGFKKNWDDIYPSAVEELVNDKNYIILDVRSQGEFRTGHIKNARLIPLPELKKRLTELDQNKTIITVCASGARSASAASTLSKNGFTVKNMIGGMHRWTAKVA